MEHSSLIVGAAEVVGGGTMDGWGDRDGIRKVWGGAGDCYNHSGDKRD